MIAGKIQMSAADRTVLIGLGGVREMVRQLGEPPELLKALYLIQSFQE